MKLFLRYLKSRLGVLLLFAAFALILAFSFVLYHLPAEAVLYPAALCLVLDAVVLVLDFLRVRRRHILVSDLSEMESELPETGDIEAADYRDIVLRLRDKAVAGAGFGTQDISPGAMFTIVGEQFDGARDNIAVGGN